MDHGISSIGAGNGCERQRLVVRERERVRDVIGAGNPPREFWIRAAVCWKLEIRIVNVVD